MDTDDLAENLDICSDRRRRVDLGKSRAECDRADDMAWPAIRWGLDQEL
ncbi:hypothetical protein [Mesorhizobium ciceri]